MFTSVKFSCFSDGYYILKSYDSLLENKTTQLRVVLQSVNVTKKKEKEKINKLYVLV